MNALAPQAQRPGWALNSVRRRGGWVRQALSLLPFGSVSTRHNLRAASGGTDRPELRWDGHLLCGPLGLEPSARGDNRSSSFVCLGSLGSATLGCWYNFWVCEFLMPQPMIAARATVFVMASVIIALAAVGPATVRHWSWGPCPLYHRQSSWILHDSVLGLPASLHSSTFATPPGAQLR